MLKSSLIALLAASSAVYAQFALRIAQPNDGEYVQLNSIVPVEIQAPNTTAGAEGPEILLSLCTEITGLPLCNNTMGTVLLTAPFCPPDEIYNVVIPGDQKPGLTRLIAGHVNYVNGTPTLTDQTSIELYLGGRI